MTGETFSSSGAEAAGEQEKVDFNRLDEGVYGKNDLKNGKKKKKKKS